MTTMGTKGAIDTTNAIVGQWPDVNFLALTGERINLGNVFSGVLEMNREDFMHYGSTHPRIVDYVVPMQTGMRFTGEATEFHRALFHALIGDSLTSTSQYIYSGVATCSTYFTFQAMRPRSCDGWTIETRIFKCRPGGTLAFGSSENDDVRMPFSVEGLDDQANAMGQGGSATAPLGYLYVPTEGANVVTNVSVA